MILAASGITPAAARQAATERYPTTRLKAGVDLTERATVQAVIDQMDALVTRMEAEAAKIR